MFVEGAGFEPAPYLALSASRFQHSLTLLVPFLSANPPNMSILISLS